MWKCVCCGQTALLESVRNFMVCSKCGSIIATKDTPQKHQYLKDVCSVNDYKLVIDACAGSGMVQFQNGELKEGSPLILENVMKDKGRCICIEVEPKTYKLLKSFCKNAQIHCGDCNKILPDLIDGKSPTLVYIDPFGYGVPAVERKLVLKIAKIPNTDLLIHFSWRIAREMGYARKYLTSTDKTLKKRASSFAESLNVWWGTSDWLKWGSMTKKEYAEMYAYSFKENNTVDITAFGNHGISFFLIFATKFKLPRYGIMKWVKPNDSS